ncbi:glycoside hydrolase family 127 protein [Niabella aquatica]
MSAAQPLPTAKSYQLSDVRLLDGSPFYHAMQKDKEWLLALEPDRLLSGFRSEAGLQPKAPKYGGWESQGVGGQSLGHYLSACAMMYAATGDTALLNKINYIIDELRFCQRENGNGYVAAIPGGKKIFADIKEGKIYSKGFDLNGGWVPWYNIHKTCAGLIDAYRLTGNKTAKNILIDLSDWAIDIHKNLSHDQMQQILRCEPGGINESFAEVYALTGDFRYLALARKFNDDALLTSLAQQKDNLAGLHANTQIPKVIGVARQYELGKQKRDEDIARFFWDIVAQNHSYANGGNSDAEHFGMAHQIANRLSNKTTETCNTYNMLKLTHHLFNWYPDVRYADFYERALYNHILGSQNPSTGMVSYFTPLAPGYKKSFSAPFESFWCCVGTGLENHSRYGEFIYSKSADKGVFINLFIPSVLEDKGLGLKMAMHSQLTAGKDELTLTLQLDRDKSFPLYLRIPAWAQDAGVFVNGKKYSLQKNMSGSYLKLQRKWKSGDVISCKFPMSLRIETTPDDEDLHALAYGPFLLSSKLKSQFSFGNDSIPVVVSDEKEPSVWLSKIQDEMRFVTKEAGVPAQLEFQPFYKEINNPYQVYFRLYSKAKWEKIKNSYFDAGRQAALEKANTVDDVQLGEMQPERDHDFAGSQPEAGQIRNSKYRKTEPGGWFSFKLKVMPQAKQKLVLTYPGNVSNESGFDIYVDDRLLASDAVHWFDGDEINKVYPIPDELVSGKSAIVIALRAKPGKIAGELIRARIIKE